MNILLRIFLGLFIFLAVVFCLVLVQSAISKPPDRGGQDPIWKIFQDGAAQSVPWVDADNSRFAVYDAGTPSDITDDVVLDKETGLVWDRSPSTVARNWYTATLNCYSQCKGERKGWRLQAGWVR